MPHIPPIVARRERGVNRFFSHIEEDLGTEAGPYTYSFVESKWDAVVVVPVLADGRLVVERIYRHPYRAYLHEFPAGGIEPGEDPCAAGIRELEEETGWRAAACRKLGAFEAMPGLLRMRLHVVLATGLEQTGTRSLEALELIDVEEMTRAEAWAAAEAEHTSSFLVHGLLYLDRFVPG
jgi:ADP-ribose pyrophosphatase